MYVWIYILFNRNTGRTHRLAMLHAALINMEAIEKDYPFYNHEDLFRFKTMFAF